MSVPQRSDAVVVIGREADGEYIFTDTVGELAYLIGGLIVPTSWLRIVEPTEPPEPPIGRYVSGEGSVWHHHIDGWLCVNSGINTSWEHIHHYGPFTRLIPAPDPDDDALVDQLYRAFTDAMDAARSDSWSAAAKSSGIRGVLRALRDQG